MKLRATAAALDIDAFTALGQHNPALAEGLRADIEAGATMDDVRAFVDCNPVLSNDEAVLVIRAAAHLLDGQEATP